MKILILALSGIGDALMFTPAISLMRKSFPEAQIDSLVMFKGVNDIYTRLPELNNVFLFEFMKEGALPSLKYLLSMRSKYDVTINVYPSNRKEYNIINFLLGAVKKAGVRYLRQDSKNLGYLNNVRITEDDSVHNVRTNIKLCSEIFNIQFNLEPDLQFPLLNEDLNFARNYLGSVNINDGDLVIGFHPGSAVLKNHEKRRLEPDKFARLAQLLIAEKNAKVLIFGGPEESDLKNTILSQINDPNAFAVNTGSLAETAAVMKRCSVFVSNDSSLMHVASAMKLKVTAVIGPTNVNYIHPWNTEYNIVSLDLECAPCFIYSPRPLICFRDDVKFKCIKEITPKMVFTSVIRLLDK